MERPSDGSGSDSNSPRSTTTTTAAATRAAELAGAFTALPRLRAMEVTFANPEDPFTPASAWLEPVVEATMRRLRDAGGGGGAPRRWALWDLSDPVCVLALRGRRRDDDDDDARGDADDEKNDDDDAAVLRAAANCTPPKRFKATPLHMAVAASPAEPKPSSPASSGGGGGAKDGGGGDGGDDDDDDAPGTPTVVKGGGSDVERHGPWRVGRRRAASDPVRRRGGEARTRGGVGGGVGDATAGPSVASAAAVRALIAMGADVDARDRSGATPLFLAAEGGRVDALRALLDGGAEIAARNNLGENANYIAALKGCRLTSKMLISECEAAGARWQDAAWYGDGWTPLHAAACANRVDVANDVLAAAASAKDGNVVVAAANRYGATSLHIASLLGSAPLTDALLRSGAPASARDGNGMRPIDVAMREGHVAVCELLRAATKEGGGGGGGGGGDADGPGGAPREEASAPPRRRRRRGRAS